MRLASSSLLSRCSALVACVVLAAGCYRSSDPPPSGAATPADTTPVGPPPRLGGDGPTRLPAVSADGTKVLIETKDRTVELHNPNSRVAVKNRQDVEIGTKVVLGVAEVEGMLSADQHPEREQRLAAANRWLAEQNAVLRLQPLTPLEVESYREYLPEDFRATGLGVTLEWKEDRVRIVQGGKTLVDRATPRTWRADGFNKGCDNPPFLGSASIDLQRKIAVLTIDYYGTDSCWEPPATHHVVAW
jgi:hypothetical protein